MGLNDTADFIKFLEESQNSPKPEPKSIAYVCRAVVGGLTVFFTLGSYPFILPYFRRIVLPYLPATSEQIKNVFEALKGRSGTFIDLGSGDGRIVFAAARNGFDSTGIDKNPWLLLYSKLVSFSPGLKGRAKFHLRNIWSFDLKPYNNVTIFGVESMMSQLEKKFVNELQEGTHIVACRFPLPTMKPVKTVGSGLNKVWLYVSGTN